MTQNQKQKGRLTLREKRKRKVTNFYWQKRRVKWNVREKYSKKVIEKLMEKLIEMMMEKR